MTGRWLSPGTLVYYTNKTDCHDITESGVKHHKLKTNQRLRIDQKVHFFKYYTYHFHIIKEPFSSNENRFAFRVWDLKVDWIKRKLWRFNSLYR